MINVWKALSVVKNEYSINGGCYSYKVHAPRRISCTFISSKAIKMKAFEKNLVLK